MRCIVVLMDKTDGEIAETVATLQKSGAMSYTTVVAAPTSLPRASQFLAPLTAAAVGSATADRVMFIHVLFIRVLYTLRTQISRPICTVTHFSRHRHHQTSRPICTFTHTLQLGESVRDAGGHCLVVIDDLEPHIQTYNALCDSLLDSASKGVGTHILWRHCYSSST
jgi:F0F1-type ATP synthase alpha subunit